MLGFLMFLPILSIAQLTINLPYGNTYGRNESVYINGTTTPNTMVYLYFYNSSLSLDSAKLWDSTLSDSNGNYNFTWYNSTVGNFTLYVNTTSYSNSTNVSIIEPIDIDNLSPTLWYYDRKERYQNFYTEVLNITAKRPIINISFTTNQPSGYTQPFYISEAYGAYHNCSNLDVNSVCYMTYRYANFPYSTSGRTISNDYTLFYENGNFYEGRYSYKLYFKELVKNTTNYLIYSADNLFIGNGTKSGDYCCVSKCSPGGGSDFWREYLSNHGYPYSFNLSENPVLRNCIVDFPIEYPLIDGGDNIIVDSLQVQSIFADIQNGDFHLAPGSIAIDAGFDTLGYYYPFDFDFNYRVWDGDGNGSAIIDIGPYEYGSPSFGGIQGITSDPTTGEPVDYVLIKINNEPGEFTFSDSIGNFEYKLPTGTYNVYAERVFYDDAVEYQIEVLDGEYTQLDIPMCETVDVEEHTIPNSSFQISHLTNYPNPFNPSTTISFSLNTEITEDSDLAIYNLKGQKVKTLPISSRPEFIEGSAYENNTPRPSSFDSAQDDKLRMSRAGSYQYSVVWHGTDENNRAVSSGIYFAKLIGGKIEVSCKLMLLK